MDIQQQLNLNFKDYTETGYSMMPEVPLTQAQKPETAGKTSQVSTKQDPTDTTYRH